ncbi:hypothetical protein IMZ11_02665 [Microtetraspora sp. AC03309]|uniref:hypothetical protein n=1 Tax=Microtetraspora sp. AC03309 TaxID=2779376 RepID=UPI001E2C55F4|nr:hypothetical protein [Microtetraspora sp. AC03309]MCC5574542.1 hypothetical protein [Microtetraspora sp. AC03309]
MSKKRKAQEYSAEEFDQTVALIRSNASVRLDIEAITGEKLDGKTPRELFDLFRSIEQATQIQVTVARYGQARRLLAQTRVDMESLPPAHMPVETAKFVEDLQRRLDVAKRENTELRTANAALRDRGNVTPIAGRVIQGKAVAR